MSYFWSEFCSATVKLSIETLTEETKPVVGDKFEFEDRNESIVLAPFGIFGQSEFRPKEET